MSLPEEYLSRERYEEMLPTIKAYTDALGITENLNLCINEDGILEITTPNGTKLLSQDVFWFITRCIRLKKCPELAPYLRLSAKWQITTK